MYSRTIGKRQRRFHAVARRELSRSGVEFATLDQPIVFERFVGFRPNLFGFFRIFQTIVQLDTVQPLCYTVSMAKKK